MRHVIQKQNPLRSKKLTGLARGKPCFFTFPHVCKGDVVACHANWQIFGRGTGFKTPDWAIAFGCGDAHNAIDNKLDKRLDQDQRQTEWMNAFVSTQNYLWEHGLLQVNSKAHNDAMDEYLRG